jgi:protein-tyrosine-phosphatase
VTDPGDPEPTTVAFVCVQNAGRSQMAAAFAGREVARRGLTDRVRVLTGGTDPADAVHDVVVEAMAEVGFDLGDETPREVTRDEMAAVDVVVTMGCSAASVCPTTWRGDARDWALDDPRGRDPETVRSIRDEVEARVRSLLDELEAEGATARGDA